MNIFGIDITWKKRAKESVIDRANVSYAEYGRGDTRQPPGIPGLIARGTEYCAICATMNANSLASVEFRLYRRKRKGRSGGRSVGREARKYLRGDASGSPGIKASVYAREASDIEEVTDHPAIDLVRDPNANDQAFTFWQAQHKRKELCGNAFYGVGDEGGRVWLKELFPQWVVIEPSVSGADWWYWYGRDQSYRVKLMREEVLHEKFEKSLYQPWYGSGPLESIIMSSDIYTQARTAEMARWRNEARPDVMVMVDKETTSIEAARLREYLHEQMSGPTNRGRLLVMPGVDVKPIAWSMKDMEYQAGLREMKLTIANAYGIPFTILDRPSSNLASSLTGDTFYASNTLQPRACKHAEWLTETLLPLFGEAPGEYWFAPENVVPENDVFQLDEATRLVGAGIRTINEVRSVDGMDPIEGGDVPRVNGVPIDMLGIQPMAATGAPVDGADPVATPEPSSDQTSAGAAREFNGAQVASALQVLLAVSDGTLAPDAATIMLIELFGIAPDRAASMVAAQESQRDVVKEEAAEAAATEAANTPPPTEPKEPEKSAKCCSDGRVSQKYHYESKAVAPSNETERRVADAAKDHVQAQLAALFAAMEKKPMGLRHFGRAATKSVSEETAKLLKAWGVLDFEKALGDLEARMKPILSVEFTRAGTAGANDIARLEPRAKPFSISAEPVTKWVDKWTASLLEGLDGFNHTTADAVGAAISESIEANENIYAMQKRIRAAFDANTPSGVPMSEYRSYVIGRTETARATGHGQMAGWDASGVVKGKAWGLSSDPCQFCLAANAEHGDKSIGLGEAFYSLGETVTGVDGGVMVIDFVPVMDPAELHPQCRCYSKPVIGVSDDDS